MNDDAGEAWNRRKRARLGREEPTPEVGVMDSPVASLLLDLRYSGVIPAYVAQQIAAAVNTEFETYRAPHPAVIQLASLGTSGEFPNNVGRDMDLAMDMDDLNIPEPLFVKCWVKDRRCNPPALVQRDLPIWCPHELASSIYENFRHEFDERFLGPPGELQRFWASVKPSDPRFKDHEVWTKDGYQHKAFPLRIHGDSVPYGKGSLRNLDCVSVSSPCGTGGALDKLFLAFAVPASISVSKGPFQSTKPLWRRFIWSKDALFSGRHPTVDWNRLPWDDTNDPSGKFRNVAGKPLFGDLYFAVLAMLSADHDYLSNTLKLRHFNAVPNCCFGCNAMQTDGPLSYTDVRRTAGWRSTLETDSSFRLLYENEHLIWTALTLGMIILDLMHVVDLGVLQYFVASSVLCIVKSFFFRGTVDKKIEFIWGVVMHVYHDLGVPDSSRLPFAKFKSVIQEGNASKFPYLGGKAAQTRRFLPCLLLLIDRLNLIGRRFQHIKVCLESIITMYDIMMAHEWDLGDDATRAVECVDKFCLHQNALCADAVRNNELLFQITVKTHFLQHSALVFEFYNPRKYWNYLDEDLMGRVATMARHVCKGVSFLALSTHIFARYRKRLYVRLLRRQRCRQRRVGL